MRRFSLRTLMAVIVLSALGFAALRNASALWAGIMLLTILAMLGVATLGMIFLRHKERAWSVGFALFTGDPSCCSPTPRVPVGTAVLECRCRVEIQSKSR